MQSPAVGSTDTASATTLESRAMSLGSEDINGTGSDSTSNQSIPEELEAASSSETETTPSLKIAGTKSNFDSSAVSSSVSSCELDAVSHEEESSNQLTEVKNVEMEDEEKSNGVTTKPASDKKDSTDTNDNISTHHPSINKTLLTEKVTNNSQHNSKDTVKISEEFQEDPTMPDIEAFQCPKGIMHDLAEPGFDMWRLDRDSMVDHIEYMFHDLGIVRAWKIPRTTLKMFLLGVRERYQDNPYHNFKHCFCVTQMTYSILCKLRLRGLISVDHMGALLTAAVCHDVDHPGLNNSYHCHARTPLAILYNYQSILEQHHFAVTCRILSNKERNIFRNVQNRDEVLTNIGELILATDLSRHKKITEDYTMCLSVGFDFKNSEHVMALMKIIIKCADVSNEVRPETVSGPWVERLFAEYYEQSAREKREHLPVTPYMDPDLINISASQEDFIRGMMLPLYHQLSKLVVDAQLYYVNPIYETLTRYEVQNMRDREV